MKIFSCLGLALALLLAAHAQAAELLVAQKGDRALAIVNPEMGMVIANVEEHGVTGHEVAATPDGRIAAVPIYGNSGVGRPGTDGSNILFIDLSTRQIVHNLEFPHGVRPHCVMVGHGGLLYVTTELDQAIAVIDPKTYKIVGSIPTGQPQSHMLVLSNDGRRGYTANVGPGTVSVLDIEARKLVKVIPVSGQVQRIAISNDDRWVFTSDQTKPRMAVVDTASLKVAKWIPLDGLGYGAAPTKDGLWLLVAVPDSNDVDVIDLKTMKVARTVPLGAGASPQEVLVRPNGKAAYVSCAGHVAEIDLATWRVTRTIATGKGTDGLAWAQ